MAVNVLINATDFDIQNKTGLQLFSVVSLMWSAFLRSTFCRQWRNMRYDEAIQIRNAYVLFFYYISSNLSTKWYKPIP